MQHIPKIERTVQGAQHTKDTDLTLSRVAGGVALERLSSTLVKLAAPHYGIDVRTPDEEDDHHPVELEIVDEKAVRMNSLRRRGITPRKMHLGLTYLAPSVLKEQRVQAVGAFVFHTRGSDEYYLSLRLDEDGVKKAGDERRRVWGGLGRLGGFSTNDIPWLARPQELRLLYVPPNPDMADMSRETFVEQAEATMLTAVADGGMEIVLAPAYDAPARPQSAS